MEGKKFAALLLVLIGAFALIFGVTTYTHDARVSDATMLNFTVMRTQPVPFSIWVGTASLIAGGALLLWRKMRSRPPTASFNR